MPRAFANGAKGWATRPLLSICHPERSRGTLRLALPTRRSMFRVPPLPARHQPGGGLQDGAPRRYVHQHSAIHDSSHGRPVEDRSRIPRGQGGDQSVPQAQENRRGELEKGNGAACLVVPTFTKSAKVGQPKPESGLNGHPPGAEVRTRRRV